MSQILFEYHRIAPTTWVYLASLLMIGLFFMFNRIWSVRNLDLILLILLAPGLLLVYEGRKLYQTHAAVARQQTTPSDSDQRAADSTMDAETSDSDHVVNGDFNDSDVALVATAPPELSPEQQALQRGRNLEYFGFLWLLSVNAIILIRLMIDPTMVRRPLLEPNLSTGGLAFIGCSLFVFMMANVITSTSEEQYRSGPGLGPGYAWMDMLPAIPTTPEYDVGIVRQVVDDRTQQQPVGYATAARVLAILAHLAVVLGVVAIGYRHFANIKTGIGAATLYLMLPYTSQMTGRVDHVLPAAFLVWAVLWYRRPLVAGLFLGLASGVVYYPLFLLPLWLSFYWQRGLMRFVGGFAATIGALVLLLLVHSGDGFGMQLQRMFGLWLPVMSGLKGVWELGWDPVYRLPVLAAFIVLSGTFALWPAQKNLGTLLSCSAAVMVASQFWHGYGGGLYMAWYLPLLVLTIFRPNLEDRVALVVLGEGWLRRRRLRVAA